ncbi:hypothetical protein D9758_015700 [Tetrapyrgos nigripes]|uniref:Uncharacterized protein n=1 Tax=Tetrapyrgos nigripes TaxID=182062 RepID=A0A8H5C9Y5_9AGAR|nr:hypothetical protein D9758_015700 [Tetrapyrgos nigripes]
MDSSKSSSSFDSSVLSNSPSSTHPSETTFKLPAEVGSSASMTQSKRNETIKFMNRRLQQWELRRKEKEMAELLIKKLRSLQKEEEEEDVAYYLHK